MSKVVVFEYCAFIIEILIFVSIYQRGLSKGRVNRWFVALMSTVTMATVTDIFGMELEVFSSGFSLLKFIFNTLCLWSTAMISVVLCGYLFAQTGMWYIIKNNKLYRIILYTPMIANTVLMFIINPFTKIVFFIDENGIYARGDYVLVLYTLSLIYVAVGIWVVIKFRNIYTIRKIFSVMFLLLSSIIGTAIQLIFPNVIFQMFCTAWACLILFVEVQAPEERIHPGTGLFSLNAYAKDTKNLFEIKAPFAVTIAVMTNYDAIIEMLGYFNAVKIPSIIADEMVRFSKKIRVDADHYYLGNGKFAVVIDDRFIDRQFEVAQGINAIVQKDFDINDTKVKALCNVCLINCPKDIDNPDFLIAFDDRLALEAYSGELRYAEKLFSKREFEFKRDFKNILDRAFEENYFYLEYQPIYDADEFKYSSVEAFLRLNDPEYGYIPPDKIIVEAEKSEIIHAITVYVVEEVCKFVSSSDFLLTGLDFVEINLSPMQCMWDDLLTVLLATLRSFNVQPKHICFNITDVEDPEIYKRMQANLEALSQIGFGLILDDFGAGIFEIERIANMPLTAIKLDKEFVKNGLDPQNLCVLKGTVRMISDMDIKTACIGVENDYMLKQLKYLGCRYMQGYYYCKSMSQSDLMKYLLLG